MKPNLLLVDEKQEQGRVNKKTVPTMRDAKKDRKQSAV